MWLQQLPNGTTLDDVIVWVDGFGTSDRKNKTAYTFTNTTEGANIFGGRYIAFNGTTSLIDCGTQLLGTGDVTVTAWINPTNFGENSTGRIVDNGKLIVSVWDTNDRIVWSSDGAGTNPVSAVNSILATSTHFVAVTRPTGGDNCNCYIDGVLSGTANQDSGTPATGDTNLIIGNKADATRTFNGNITNVIIFNKLLTITQIGQMYNKHKVGV